MNAALGINQLKKINFFWKKRKKIWDFYNSNLGDLPIKLPPKITKGYKHAYHLYTIIIDKSKTNKTREEAINFLQKNRIGIGIHYNSIQSFKYYKNKVKFNNAELKVSNLICKNIFSIPIYPDLTKVDQIYIIKKIKDFFHV